MKTMIHELMLALKENEANLLSERRVSMQLDLLLVRMEIMKSLVSLQAKVIADLSEDQKEAA